MANNSRERIFKITLVALIVGLGIILFRQARPFFGGILSALRISINCFKRTSKNNMER